MKKYGLFSLANQLRYGASLLVIGSGLVLSGTGYQFGSGIFVATIILAIIWGQWLARRVIAPLQALAEATTKIKHGNLNNPISYNAPDELGELVGSFNGMIAELQTRYATMEQKIIARTRHLEIVADLGDQLSSILNLNELLGKVVNQIKESFGYHYVLIYLVDEKRENLLLAEGAGQTETFPKTVLLNESHSLVAQVACTGIVGQASSLSFADIAVPLILDNQVMGVLVVQAHSLDEGDENLLRSLASHVAISIRNANLFADVETSLAEARISQERYIQQAWDRDKIKRRGQGCVQFALDNGANLPENIIAEAHEQILTSGEFGKLSPLDFVNTDLVGWGIPLESAQVTIGNMQLYDTVPRQWTDGELAFINAVLDQVVQIAQSLRLVDELQERAGREKLISEISDKLRRSPDVDTLMKITVSELAHIFRPTRTFVNLSGES